ncbi:MAG TPA: phospholipase D-like domain-containing protein [Steroidobacteraceae bacterium]|nr:phospholipase D-like domain-containing protein [Steroidobacteraceae bacterium]
MWTIAAALVATLVVVLLVSIFHTPEKKIQHQVHHLYGVLDPQFEREMGTLLGPAILPGNRITALQNGDEIFPAMLKAIRGAEHTINFETYIYWSGHIGEEFAQALIERVRAGVKVHLMLDWLGSEKMAPQLVSQMRDAGVEIERFHALHWFSLGKLNNRTHRKVLIVDGKIGFTGGVGIADEWTGHAQDPDHWRDMHFLVEGPVVAQFQSAFLDNWIETTGRVLTGETYFPPLAPMGELKMHMFMSSPEGGSESMRLMYLMAITAAEQSIDIEAAYFIPDTLMSRELIKARARGVRIRILLPGKHMDSETVRIATKRAWGPLLESGVEIHEYEPTMLHCKMLIFDHYMVSVGSTNFDMRSFELNDEASLNIYDAAFAKRMTEVFEDDLHASTPYGLLKWRQRSWLEKMAEVILIPIKSQL